jgi:hypothetical protein
MLFCANARTAGTFVAAPETAKNTPKSLAAGRTLAAIRPKPTIARTELKKMKGVRWRIRSAQYEVPKETITAKI